MVTLHAKNSAYPSYRISGENFQQVKMATNVTVFLLSIRMTNCQLNFASTFPGSSYARLMHLSLLCSPSQVGGGWQFWRVSLITGMEYGTEQWNGIWNGQWMYTEQVNHVIDALLSLGWAIPTTAWAFTSLQRLYEQVIADIVFLLPHLVCMLSC